MYPMRTKAFERHFELNELIEKHYKAGDYNKCEKYCIEDIQLFPQFRNDWQRIHNDNIPRIPSFQTLTLVYDKQERYSEAIQICDLAINFSLDDGTKSGFEGRKIRLQKKLENPKPKETNILSIPATSEMAKTSNITSLQKNHTHNLPWSIGVSFGKSSSDNLLKAITLAKASDFYYEYEFEGSKIYQGVFSHHSNSFLNFIQLYELVGSWKSSFAMLNGRLSDRKIISGINYCYGDKCRSGRSDFCFGASEFTINPFGCHRLQMSVVNNPWWTFHTKIGNVLHINKNGIRARAKEYGYAYRECPSYNQQFIDEAIDNLPDKISFREYNDLLFGKRDYLIHQNPHFNKTPKQKKPQNLLGAFKRFFKE